MSAVIFFLPSWLYVSCKRHFGLSCRYVKSHVFPVFCRFLSYLILVSLKFIFLSNLPKRYFPSSLRRKVSCSSSSLKMMRLPLTVYLLLCVEGAMAKAAFMALRFNQLTPAAFSISSLIFISFFSTISCFNRYRCGYTFLEFVNFLLSLR